MPISNYDKTRPWQLGIRAFNLLSLAEVDWFYTVTTKGAFQYWTMTEFIPSLLAHLSGKFWKQRFFSPFLKKKKDTGPKPSTPCSVFEAFSTLKQWKNDSVLYRAMLVISELARNNWRHFYIGLNLSHYRIRKRWFSSVHTKMISRRFFFF